MSYDPNFLGFPLPLPTASPSRVSSVLRKEDLTDGDRAEYPNYAVVTDKDKRSPMFAVLLIDGAQKKTTRRSNNWRIDTRIGREFQLDNSYYTHNRWDRGHMARRDSAGWGPTQQAAQRASDETFYYSNACLQHENLNQDEWLMLEDWAADLAVNAGRRVVVFTGPVFGDAPRIIEPEGRPAAHIPAAFFKVVCWASATAELEVAAFLVHQDTEALKDTSGRHKYNYQHYQVTIREIEAATGLDFPDQVYERNPLYYYESDTAKSAGAEHFPERFDVNAPGDIIRRDGQGRYSVLDDEVEVYIAAAHVIPDVGQTEWVSLVNLGSTDVVLDGWQLTDRNGRKATLAGVLAPGASIVLSGSTLGTVQLADKGGVLTLKNASGAQIDRVDYTERDVKNLREQRKAAKERDPNAPIKPINFFTYRR